MFVFIFSLSLVTAIAGLGIAGLISGQ